MFRTLRLRATTMLAVSLLGACNAVTPADPQPETRTDARGGSQVAPTPAPRAKPTTQAKPSPLATNAPHAESRQCRFEVDGKHLVDGSCQVYPMGDGGYTLNTWSAGKPSRSHFAVVSMRGDGKADASWNADPDDDKAMDLLGIVTLQDGCWVNARARICAR